MVQRKSVSSSSRKELLEVLNVAKPAVGRALFVPVLSHFCITGDQVIAYDDSIGIAINHKLPVTCAVPADLLLKLLNSLSADDMTLEVEGGHLVVSCGRSNLKVPALGEDSFIFRGDVGSKRRFVLDLNKTTLAGIEACTISVGVDPTHPAQMGVTLEGDGESGVLYSTDNVTLSRFELDQEVHDTSIIMPTAFCVQLCALSRKFEADEVELSVYDSCVVARWPNALLYGKLIANDKPLDFGKVFDRMMPKGSKGKSADVPAGWESAFLRAAAVVDAKHPVTTLQVTDEELLIKTQSQYGAADDRLSIEGAGDCPPFLVDPAHVARATKLCSKVAFFPDALVMKEGPYTHLISHCAE